MNIEDLVRGDVIGIDWIDIAEDTTADADSASLARRHSIGVFWSTKLDDGIPVLVTTTTLDKEVEGQQGYCIYPVACVVKVKMIKAKRRKRAPKERELPG